MPAWILLDDSATGKPQTRLTYQPYAYAQYRQQVQPMAEVMDLLLPTIHGGLHIKESIEEHGETHET